jgi:hypothetical protein
MSGIRLRIEESTVYEGEVVAVPRVGDRIRRGDEDENVQAVVWDYQSGANEHVILVDLIVGSQPYTY